VNATALRCWPPCQLWLFLKT